MLESFLTEEEAEQLVLNLMKSKGVATDEEVIELLQWAERVRLEATMLKLALMGEICITGIDKEEGPLLVHRDFIEGRN